MTVFEDIPVWLPLLVSFAIVSVMAIRSRARDLLFYLAAFYFFLAFGPFVNFLLGNEIYHGTIRTTIVTAAVVSTLAIAGMFGASLLGPARPSADQSDANLSQRHFPLLRVYFAALGSLTLFLIVSTGQDVAGLAKTARIGVVGADLHYGLLLLQFYAGSLYFLIGTSSVTRALYFGNFALFVLYCGVFSERDFMFVIAAIVTHRFVSGSLRLRPVPVGGLLALLLIGTYMFQIRFGESGFGLEDVLNQALLLFIDSYVLYLVPDAIPHMSGWTYLNSFLNLVPSWIYHTDFHLIHWFVQQYAPRSSAGYGFTLASEAYLNFGLIGVPVVFAALGVVQRWLNRRFYAHPFFAYASVLYAGLLAYAFRGDSLQLMKGLVYGIVVFGLLWIGSTRRVRVPRITEAKRQLPSPAGVSDIPPFRAERWPSIGGR